MGWERKDGDWVFRSEDPRAPRAWIEVSTDRSRHVVVENHGEHHMGAESVVIVPDRPVAGVARFHTTNGQAKFDPNGRWLIVEGVVGFVAVNLQDGSVAHYKTADGGLIGTWSIVGGVLEWTQARIGASTKESKACPLDELRARWQPGLGGFADGIFQPDEGFVAKWDRWSDSGDRAKAMLPLPQLDRETEGAFTVEGNRSAGLLALAVVVTIAVIAGLIIGVLSRRDLGSDTLILFLALLAMIGLAPGLVVAETLVRHPRWIHFGTESIVVRQVIGKRRRATSRITEIRSVQYTGNAFRFPLHVMVIVFANDKPLRVDSDMIARVNARDVATMESVERRVRQLYEHSGAWIVTNRRNPDLTRIIRLANRR